MKTKMATHGTDIMPCSCCFMKINNLLMKEKKSEQASNHSNSNSLSHPILSFSITPTSNSSTSEANFLAITSSQELPNFPYLNPGLRYTK